MPTSGSRGIGDSEITSPFCWEPGCCVKSSFFRAWSGSEYSFAYFAYCRKRLSNFCLPDSFCLFPTKSSSNIKWRCHNVNQTCTCDMINCVVFRPGLVTCVSVWLDDWSHPYLISCVSPWFVDSSFALIWRLIYALCVAPDLMTLCFVLFRWFVPLALFDDLCFTPVYGPCFRLLWRLWVSPWFDDFVFRPVSMIFVSPWFDVLCFTPVRWFVLCLI